MADNPTRPVAGPEVTQESNSSHLVIAANDIAYDNTASGLTATRVQTAIDEIATTAP